MPLPNSGLLHPRFHENLRRSAVADAGLPDQCTVHRASASTGAVGERLVWSPAAADLLYDGACRVQPEPTQDRMVAAGDTPVTLHRYRASIRSDADQVLVDDVLTVTVSADPQLVGRPLVIRDVVFDTFQVHRYLLLEDHPEVATP